MNMTPEQIEQWKDACDAMRDGERIQVQLLSGEWAETAIFDPRLPHRRKPKPEPWTLPPPPEGQQWHRTDWTEDMLPEGWRPLLHGEPGHEGMQYLGTNGQWVNSDASGQKSSEGNLHRRTRIPLPTPPRMVPLTRADVPFGSVFRAVSGNDFLPLQIGDQGARFWLTGEPGDRSWLQLQQLGWLINRPGDNDADGKPVFRKCEKEETK
jgi:hypothetical protein